MWHSNGSFGVDSATFIEFQGGLGRDRGVGAADHPDLGTVFEGPGDHNLDDVGDRQRRGSPVRAAVSVGAQRAAPAALVAGHEPVFRHDQGRRGAGVDGGQAGRQADGRRGRQAPRRGPRRQATAARARPGRAAPGGAATAASNGRICGLMPSTARSRTQAGKREQPRAGQRRRRRRRPPCCPGQSRPHSASISRNAFRSCFFGLPASTRRPPPPRR